jgi:hypothetical protein
VEGVSNNGASLAFQSVPTDGEFVKLVVAEEIGAKVGGRYQKGSVQDASEDESVLECDALVVKAAVRKIGEISFTRIPRKRRFRRRTHVRDGQSGIFY